MPMIRTTLSFCLLFGGLLVASKWLHESSSHELPITESKTPAAIEQAPSEPGLIPISAEQPTAVLQPVEANAVQLVAFNDPLDDVLNSLRPQGAAIGRAAD